MTGIISYYDSIMSVLQTPIQIKCCQLNIWKAGKTRHILALLENKLDLKFEKTAFCGNRFNKNLNLIWITKMEPLTSSVGYKSGRRVPNAEPCGTPHKTRSSRSKAMMVYQSLGVQPMLFSCFLKNKSIIIYLSTYNF